MPGGLAEQIFNMKFTAKQLNKLSTKHEKEMNKEKKKIKAVSSPCLVHSSPHGPALSCTHAGH